MPRQKTEFALTLPPREPGVAAVRWIHTAVRAAILEGRLRPGARLPATRDVARHYRLSRGTIVSAFEQLEAEGYLEARVGSGTRVAAVLPDRLLEAVRPAQAGPAGGRSRPLRLSQFSLNVRGLGDDDPPRIRAFRTNLPALELFPAALWAQVAARRYRRATTEFLRGCGPMGYPPLQQAVAHYLGASRGVFCEPGQVAIVSGVQEALDLAARLLLDPGDTVAIEDPGYTGAARVFESCGARISPVPLDGEGITLGPELEGARLVYVTPAHQFPLCMSMSLARRLALLEWARSTGALIFEDDYDSEYRYSGRPMPALQGLARHGQVLFAGSFSKVLFPSLRLGYLVVPADLVDAVAAARSITSRHAPLPGQAVLADFMDGGHFGRHVRRMRGVYAERLAVLLECMVTELAGGLEVSDIEAGLQTAAWLPHGTDAEAIARAAARRQVEVTPLSRYARRPMKREGLVLGFAGVDTQEIRRGVRELASALQHTPVESLSGRRRKAR
jgi:GntR family transcriptional regulator/MocR family aminotransferase